jgi:hypothetical protein
MQGFLLGLIFLFFNYVLIFIRMNGQKSTINDVSKVNTSRKILVRKSVNPNFLWTVNNNVAQYSCYLINNSTHAWIESMILIWGYEIGDVAGLRCHIRVNGSNKAFEIIPSRVYAIGGAVCRKVVVQLNETLREEISKSKISVAIVSKRHGNASDISYQTPDTVTVREPRVKAVGHCIKFINRNTQKKLDFFLYMLKQSEIAAIILHDATEDETLAQRLKNNSLFDFATLRPFYSDIISLFCQDDETCLKHKIDPNADVSSNGSRHLQHLSMNDCYVKLGYTYEFVSVFDVDEFIFPRALQTETNVKLISNWNGSLCHFENLCKQSPLSHSLYDYIMHIIRKSPYAADYSHLQSLKMHHAAMLNIHEDEGMQMTEMTKYLKRSFTLEPTRFPIAVRMGDHTTFEINRNDLAYIDYLNNLFADSQCLYPKLLNNLNIPHDFKRYVFHINADHQRNGKSIHYTKNVACVGMHGPFHASEKTVVIDGNRSAGEFLSHFRDSFWKTYMVKSTTSIRSINVDLEYLSFLLQTLTDQCRPVKM